MAQAVRTEKTKPEVGRGLDLRKLGMWTFLGSEVFFFGALLVTHLSMRSNTLNIANEFAKMPSGSNVISITPTHSVGQVRDLFGYNVITSILAFILLMSSLTMVLALDGVKAGNLKRFRFWLGATIACGLMFLGGQVYEFNHIIHATDGATITSNMFGSTFFTLTGFHGTHVFVGVIWLVSLLLSSYFHPERYNGKNYMAIEMAGLYWHFVDLVWVGIFTLVYLI